MGPSGLGEIPDLEPLLQASSRVTAGMPRYATTYFTKQTRAVTPSEVMRLRPARAAIAMEEAAATTMSSSITLCTITVLNQVTRTKAHPVANSRYSFRWAVLKGTSTKT